MRRRVALINILRITVLFAVAAASMAVAASGLLSTPPSAWDICLVKVDKAAAGALSSEFWEQTLGVSELESSWLVLNRSDAATFREISNGGFDVLDAGPSDKAYFYVRISGPEDIGELSRFGQVRALDERTALFWAGTDEPREIIPAKFSLARLTFIPAAESPSLFGRHVAPTNELPSQEPNAAPIPVITQLVALVSKTNLTGIISDLENFRTRYASTAACETSGTYLYDAFVRMGLQTAYETFQFSGGRYTTRNIVATFPGKTTPNKVVIVCAHYDSISNQPTTLAPGADDNGSGTATVLEIARILTGQSAALDYTVKLLCFSAEEWGLYGSAHYAQTAKNRGESIVGVIALDMIAYPNGISGKLDLVANRGSEWLADRFAAASQTYEGLGTRKVIDNSWKWSDQSSFWDQGYSALCGIENEDSQNPYYHKTTDTLSTLNMDYAASVTRATLAAAADLAQPVVVVTQYRLTIAAGAGGTTNPFPGAYRYDAGAVVNVTAAASSNFRFGGWSGDAAGTANPVPITMNSDKSISANFVGIIYPPADLQGQRVRNRSLSQTEYINVLNWNAHPDNAGLDLAVVRIYWKSGETLTKIADLPADQLSFQHRGREKNTAYDYVILFVDGEGREGDPASLTIR